MQQAGSVPARERPVNRIAANSQRPFAGRGRPLNLSDGTLHSARRTVCQKRLGGDPSRPRNQERAGRGSPANGMSQVGKQDVDYEREEDPTHSRVSSSRERYWVARSSDCSLFVADCRIDGAPEGAPQGPRRSPRTADARQSASPTAEVPRSVGASSLHRHHRPIGAAEVIRSRRLIRGDRILALAAISVSRTPGQSKPDSGLLWLPSRDAGSSFHSL